MKISFGAASAGHIFAQIACMEAIVIIIRLLAKIIEVPEIIVADALRQERR